jgi:hypothetical protein
VAFTKLKIPIKEPESGYIRALLSFNTLGGMALCLNPRSIYSILICRATQTHESAKMYCIALVCINIRRITSRKRHAMQKTPESSKSINAAAYHVPISCPQRHTQSEDDASVKEKTPRSAEESGVYTATNQSY